MLHELIEEKVSAISEQIIALRRKLHQHPEVSGSEFETKVILLEAIKPYGFEIIEGYYNTGFVIIIRGSKPGRTIGLRVDMDALEMDELVDKPFKSQNSGVMHACGHDGHMAMGVAAAIVLNDLRDQFEGNIKLIFQPAEENARSGGGAQFMIADGVLEDEPRVEAMVGMHIWPDLMAGQAGTRVGPMMAASDPFKIDIVGQGGHASMPNKCVDPILIASHTVLGLQSIVSRNVDPFEPAVVTIGMLNSGTRYNTIPESAEIIGTVRTFDETTRQLIKTRIENIAETTAMAYGGKATVQYTFGYPSVVNEKGMVDCAAQSIREVLGEVGYVNVERPAPGGEDFAYFTQKVPSVFIWLGYNKTDEKVHPPHSAYYDFDESILDNGTKIFCKTALNWLKNQ
jgi:amidohydrolase